MTEHEKAMAEFEKQFPQDKEPPSSEELERIMDRLFTLNTTTQEAVVEAVLHQISSRKSADMVTILCTEGCPSMVVFTHGATSTMFLKLMELDLKDALTRLNKDPELKMLMKLAWMVAPKGNEFDSFVAKYREIHKLQKAQVRTNSDDHK